jgi:hypothetical protein
MSSALRRAGAVVLATLLATAPLVPTGPLGAQPAPHSVILFVPDGLRGAIVDAAHAPAMDALRAAGVSFPNSHAIFPTFTTANASTMATGHLLGDTGDFSNTLDVGYKVAAAGYAFTPFLESDPVLADVDEHFGGNYLDEAAILALAHDHGYATAAIGKVGPVAIFDAADDQTGRTDTSGNALGRPLPPEIVSALTQATGSAQAPTRGANGDPGTATKPGTTVPNVEQQNWFLAAATKVVLPAFKASGKPFVLVFWSRDPDGTQHNQGDSLGALTPGINGPTSLAAIHNADDDLRALREAVHALGLDSTTDVIITSDHGFSTISKESRTSPAAQDTLNGVPAGQLPPGFLALDLAHALSLRLSDPDANDVGVHPELEHKFPSHGNGLLGNDIGQPEVIVAANGGSDLIYLPQSNAMQLAPAIVAFLERQDYVSGLFVDPRLGTFPGTLPTTTVSLEGAAVTPHPGIAVSFRSFDTGCSLPERCTVEIADTTLQQGQGMHGSFSRADTGNFTAAIGPDFKHAFIDPAPVSNADVGMTIARILGLDLRAVAKGSLLGRAFLEAMPGGALPVVTRGEERSPPGVDGVVTVVRWQRAGGERYIDAAGFPGRTVGL